MNRWGIIYCPRAGRTQKHWLRMQAYLGEHGVEYDFVQSESAESVERLAAMLVKNGYRLIVIVGGDSALNRALNGVLSVEGGHDVALAVIPAGYVNDFAHFWGYNETDYRHVIDSIIAGRERRIDVGCVKQDGDATPRYFINCANIGLASDIIATQRTARRWGVLRYFYRTFSLLFRRKERHMKLRINRDEVNRNVMNVCVGNCHGYGMTPNAVPYSGLLDVSIISHSGLKQMGEGLWLMLSGRFLNYRKSEAYRTRSAIKVTDTGDARVSLDGLMWTVAAPFSISLLPEHIKFIIPSH